MRISDIYKIASSQNSDKQNFWTKKLQDSMTEHIIISECFENFLIALYAAVKGIKVQNSDAVVFGAGNISKEYIPRLQKNINIIEVWDTYSKENSLLNIPIVEPPAEVLDVEKQVIICIDNQEIVSSIMLNLQTKGLKNTYSYREYLQLIEATEKYPNIKNRITTETEKLLEDFINSYFVFDDKNSTVNYTVIPKDVEHEKIKIDLSDKSEIELLKLLKEVLLIQDSDDLSEKLKNFINRNYDNLFNFAYELEVLLQNLLKNGVKTKERPIRMHNDYPYDQFAIYEATKTVIEYIAKSNIEALTITQGLRKIESKIVTLMAVECYFLIQLSKLEETLELAREAVFKEPNGLLSNEILYNIAVQCKNNGIKVEEALPDYDLNERFCWSGLTFAILTGYKKEDLSPEFMPCFRVLQCGANPKGESWTSDDWVEFRKSLIDGSFKYCQKNQCPNIVAGWLPKKSECNHEEVKKLIDGDFNYIPNIDELHFSYDFHCNLECHSCRLEVKHNTKARNLELDEMYNKNIAELVKKAKHLCLSGCGEAVISPHSKKVLQSLSKEENPELAVELRTNVYSLNQKTWDGIGTGKEVIKHIAASIDSCSKELFEKLRYPAKWDVVLENLGFIQSLRNNGEIDMFEFHVVVQKDNLDELIDIIKLAAKYDADVVTFSKIVNWRDMPESEYQDINPFWYNNPNHSKLIQIIEEIKQIRDEIENGNSDKIKNKKKMYINMHFVPDPNLSYDEIRVGRLKVR